MRDRNNQLALEMSENDLIVQVAGIDSQSNVSSETADFNKSAHHLSPDSLAIFTATSTSDKNSSYPMTYVPQLNDKGESSMKELTASSESRLQTPPDTFAGRSHIKPLQTFSAQDLATADLVPPDFIIDNILPAGFVILSAPPKVGKSWLALDLANSVAEGIPFWGFKTLKGSVLYMALEDSQYRLKDRLGELHSSMPESLHFAISDAGKIGSGLIEQLEIEIEKLPDLKLVILDTLGRVKGKTPAGLNAYEADTAMYASLQRLAIDHELCILGITHFNKPSKRSSDDPFERITGSMGGFGVADAAWILQGKRGSKEMNLLITGRDLIDTAFIIEFRDQKWCLKGTAEGLEAQAYADEYQNSGLINTIRQLVQDSGGCWDGTAAEIQNKMKQLGFDSSTSLQEIGRSINGYRDLLEANDGITFSQDSGGRNGRAYHFRVNEQQSIPDQDGTEAIAG